MRTGFVFHELYLWHNTGNLAGVMPYGNPVEPYEHAEHPDTKVLTRDTGFTRPYERDVFAGYAEQSAELPARVPVLLKPIAECIPVRRNCLQRLVPVAQHRTKIVDQFAQLFLGNSAVVRQRGNFLAGPF